MIYAILLQAPVPAVITAAADSLQAAAGNSATEAKMSLFELVKSGGVVMIPLALLSLITVYILIERLLFIRKISKSGANFMSSIKDFISSGNIESAKALCKNTDNSQSHIIMKGLNNIHKPAQEIESGMENAGRLELYRLEKNINILGIIAGIAPMFGFVGTILGVIKIFYNISLANNISIGLIAGGLYEKMISSVTGLSIGIFSFLAYHWLKILVNKSVEQMEIASIEFLELILK